MKTYILSIHSKVNLQVTFFYYLALILSQRYMCMYDNVYISSKTKVVYFLFMLSIQG